MSGEAIPVVQLSTLLLLGTAPRLTMVDSAPRPPAGLVGSGQAEFFGSTQLSLGLLLERD